MTSPSLIVSLLGVALALMLAARAVRARGLPPRTLAIMALAWTAIIAGLALALTRAGW